MNGFFDGDFKRRPNVSIGGASRKLTKDELLAKAQREREQRQVSIVFFTVFAYKKALRFSLQIAREQNASALKIQSYYRSYRERNKAKNVLRTDFDQLRSKYKSDDKSREELISHLLFVYHKDHDISRLVSIKFLNF